MSENVQSIDKEVSINAGMLDDVIRDLKVTRGALAALLGVFDGPSDDYSEQTGRLDAIEAVLKAKEERLQECIKGLCSLAGRPVYLEAADRHENA
jgi:hypothetical protein